MELKNTPKGYGPLDTMTAYFTVDWEYDGLSLRYIRFYPSVNTAILNDIEVTVNVIPSDKVFGAAPPYFAAINLEFVYRFVHKIDDDEIAVHHVALYGDGSSWQNPQPEWIKQNFRFGPLVGSQEQVVGR